MRLTADAEVFSSTVVLVAANMEESILVGSRFADLFGLVTLWESLALPGAMNHWSLTNQQTRLIINTVFLYALSPRTSKRNITNNRLGENLRQ